MGIQWRNAYQERKIYPKGLGFEAHAPVGLRWRFHQEVAVSPSNMLC